MNRARHSKWLYFLSSCALASESALACSVCATASEEARYAYYFTTGLLSLLPLCMIGGVIYYIAKKSK